MTSVQRLRGRSPAARTASFADRLIGLVALRAQLDSLGVICALVLTMASLSVVTAERSAPASAAVTVTVISNIDYGPEKLDLYFPGTKSDPLRPAIVLVHGGGWTGGDKAALENVTAAKDMANAGYAVFDVNYPLASATVPGYPTEVQAIATAVQYVKTNSAKYYVDPNRVGLLGGSAGANLAYRAGLLINRSTSGSVRAVAGLSGPTQLWDLYLSASAATVADPTDQSMKTGLLNLEYYLDCPDGACSKSMANAASPYSNVNRNCPATDIYNSDNEFIPLAQASNFARALTAARCTVEMNVVPGTAHAFTYWSAAKTGVIDFFKRNL
jgi:acetyl esterase